jgi:Na+-translocating ferredoxin:NAD+ oxidoreductase RNF subunit RnfB
MDVSNIIFSAVSIGGLGLLFGLGLGVAAKKFAIEVNPLISAVREALPSANCGACGYAGCDAFAKAVVEGDAKTNGCPVGGQSCADDVARIMGVEAGELIPTTAFVKCEGDCDKAKEKYEYFGISDCTAASQLQGQGSKACTYGCLGLGSCVRACMFDAIQVVNGVAVVDESKCTSCGMCVVSCPKSIIEIIPSESKIRVNCNSQEKGKDTMKACTVGCIGCRKCSKACEYEAFTFENGLAKIDYDKCVQCKACIEVCPTNAISLH